MHFKNFRKFIFSMVLGILVLTSACATNHLQFDRNQLLKEGVTISPVGHTIILVIPSDHLFVPLTDELTDQGKKLLNRIALYLQQVSYPNIHIAGNTDPIAAHMRYRGENLSLLQAKEVAGYLWDCGINDKKYKRNLTYSGENADQPIANNKTISGMKTNRRIQITIYSGELEEANVSSPFKTQYQW